MKLPAPDLAVVLVSPRNPLNIGAAARAMRNFGFETLRLVNPYDLAFREARSAVGAADLLASAGEYPTVAQAVADCSLVIGTTALGHRELQHTLRLLPEASAEIRAAAAQGRVALLFGSEKFGLSNDDLSHCHWLMRIPTERTDHSMNLGQAVAVCLYELTRSAAPAKPLREPKPAGAGDIEQISRKLIDVARQTGYIQDPTAESAEIKIRRWLRRTRIRAADAPLWLGMLRQIQWALKRKQ